MESIPLIIQVSSDVFTSIAAITATVVAIVGLNAWKKQMKGKEEYELARRYLRLIYRVRDAIKVVRNPFIPVEEMISSLKEKGMNEDDYSDHKKMNQAVYSTRWNKVQEALSDLRVEQLEAEVLWGKESVVVYDTLDQCIKKLMANIQLFLRGGFKETMDLIIYDTGEDNQFSKDIDTAVKIVEDSLRPHLM